MVGTKRAVATAHVDEAEAAEKERSKNEREGRILRLARAQLRFAAKPEDGEQPKSARWYCLQVSGGFDFAVEKLLRDCGVEVLAPCESVVKVKNGKKVDTLRAFFPGYLLVRLVPLAEAFEGLRRQKKVIGFVRGENGYHVVRDKEVNIFRPIEPVNVAELAVDRSIGQGTKCRINQGSLAGFECIVLAVRYKREARGKLQVNVSGNFVKVDDFPIAFLEKL